jgi:DNA-directed RNA polymerase specialized sigma subunit
VIIQQERNEVTTALDGQSRRAVAIRQDGLEISLNFDTSINSSQIQVHDWSKLLKGVLQELPEIQKKVIHLASKGISRREIANQSKISLGAG